MNREFKDKWVAALRSGEYKQCRDVLFNGSSHCCLGVAERIAGNGFERLREGVYIVDGGHNMCTLSDDTMNLAGLCDTDGSVSDDGTIIIGGEEYSSLSSGNDDGRTFAEIADAIEQNWERL